MKGPMQTIISLSNLHIQKVDRMHVTESLRDLLSQ